MIDTIVIQLRRTDTPDNWDIDQISDRLDTGTVRTILSADSVLKTGKLKNMKVIVSQHYVKISGSLTKYYFDNNLQTMDHDDIVTAIVWLGDELGLPIEKGFIKRIDVAKNIIVKKKVKQYLDCFDETYGYYRDRNDDRLLYKKTNRTHSISMYDKVKELKNHEREIYKRNRNGILRDKNILRLEVKLEQRINRLLEYKSVRVVHLRSETFLKKLNDFWLMKYKSILTKKSFGFSTYITTYGEIKKELLVKVIQDMGTDTLFKMLEGLRKVGKITANQKAYAKQDIKRLICGSSSLIELDHMVELMSGIEFLHANMDKDEFMCLRNKITKRLTEGKSKDQLQRKLFVGSI